MAEIGKEIQHFSHNHPLKFSCLLPLGLLGFSWRYDCDMCKLPIREDYHYRCDGCKYDLHERCGELLEQLKHPLHPHHFLTLAKRSSSSPSSSSNNNDTSCSCYYCEKPFKDYEEHPFMYKCNVQGCNFYMHTDCALIPLPTITTRSSTAEVDDDDVQYICHQHPMTTQVRTQDYWTDGDKCFACQSQWSGPLAYSCRYESCKNFLHKSCADLPRKMQHLCHSSHPLVLQVSGPRSCDSCCKKDCRLFFGCHEEGCKINLCTACAFVTVVKFTSHDHSLLLVENASCEIQCNFCQKSYKNRANDDATNRALSLLFRCIDCDFNFHFLCGPLPSTITYEYHMHPLTLFDHYADGDDSNEYYCNICEEKRDPRFRIYYCEDCKYAAHIHCLISEIMTVLKGNIKDVKLWALGETRWDVGLENLIIAEEDMTLKEMMDSLSVRERNYLVTPILFRRFRMMKSTSRFDRKESIEDVDRLEQFFQIQQADVRDFVGECDTYVDEEGFVKLLKDDKILRQKVVNVGGYRVPQTLAPILRTFLCKYHDLGFGRYLTAPMRSIAATVLCIVIDKMSKTRVEDITKDDLKHWCFYLHGIDWIANVENITPLLEPLRQVLVPSFIGLEAIRCEEEGFKNLDRRISELETELKRCNGLREKYQGYDKSAASDAMKHSFTIASEVKWKYASEVVLSRIP